MWYEYVEWICVAHYNCPVFDRFGVQFSAHRRDILGFLVVSTCPLSAHVCKLPRTSPGPVYGCCMTLTSIRDSSVGIATRYGVDRPGIESQ
jgi:hypothetical protein